MKELFITYNNTNKNETTERRILVTSEIKESKALRKCLDVTDLSNDEIMKLSELYDTYQEAYYSNIPSFAEFIKESQDDTEKLPTIKWRSFLNENTEIVAEAS